ncbi:fimbrial protein [Serratia rubidaea]|uniref:Long polar fimbrial protein LpfD n=1 Tax=Serratia rubidaea TaxID=61652 RepID=A0A448SES8_SERRU|nr:fimbrial protein [Serratia rubidaea]VEI66151.1 long polar fimbrial protein LpfD [Serratia rubidaea]
MTFIELFKRLPIISGLAILGIGAASQALAAPMPGTCVNTKGTKDFYFPFDAQYTDPENNRPGVIIHDASKGKWNLYEGYIAECGCDNMIEAYFTADSLLRAVDAEVDGWTYYVLNEYLSVASAVTIAGGHDPGTKFKVPFSNLSNIMPPQYKVPCNSVKNEYDSGATGTVNLMFRRPFVGVQVIPRTNLLEIYMSSTSGVRSPEPVARVSMSGTVTVPQNCEISPQPVVINFGEIMSARFKEKGKMPKDFTPYHQELTLACRNISDGVKVSLSFNGEADTTELDALKSDNKSIAVKIEDAERNVVAPNGGKLPVVMNYAEQTGKTEMTLYPVNTTNKPPEVGVFNSTATIRVEIE